MAGGQGIARIGVAAGVGFPSSVATGGRTFAIRSAPRPNSSGHAPNHRDRAAGRSACAGGSAALVPRGTIPGIFGRTLFHPAHIRRNPVPLAPAARAPCWSRPPAHFDQCTRRSPPFPCNLDPAHGAPSGSAHGLATPQASEPHESAAPARQPRDPTKRALRSCGFGFVAIHTITAFPAPKFADGTSI